MNYEFDQNEILNLINKTNEKLKNNLSVYQKYLLENDLKMLLELLENDSVYDEVKKNKRISNKNFLENCMEISNNLLTNFQREILSSTLPFFKDIKNIQKFDQNNEIFISKISFPIQKKLILENLNFNDKLRKANENMLKSNNHTLFISKEKGYNATYNLSNGKTFISVSNNDDILGFINLCHELGHFNEYILNNSRIDKRINTCDSKLYNYREIISIFYELLSSYILLKNNIITNCEQSLLLKDSLFNNFLNPDDYLIFDEVNKTKKIKRKDKRYIYNSYTSEYDICLYNVSYVIAVNLFEQYLIDPKETLKNIYYILNKLTGKNQERIFKDCDITPDNTKLFEKHLNKMKNN